MFRSPCAGVFTGRAHDRKVCAVQSRCFISPLPGGPTISEFGCSYVRELAENFYGIKQTKCFRAEGLDIIGADEEGILKRAQDEIKEWFSENPDTAEL